MAKKDAVAILRRSLIAAPVSVKGTVGTLMIGASQRAQSQYPSIRES